MRRNLFWLNDDQWRQIEPLLPTDVRGKARVDDRRVISGNRIALGVDDESRAAVALRGVVGKRLTYKTVGGANG